MTLHTHTAIPKEIATQQPLVKSVPVRSLTTTLDLPLHPRQISQLRGAVVEAMGKEHDLLHNHRDQGDKDYHYRYSLVQYRVRNGQATLFGVQQGAELIRQFLLQHRQLTIGERTVPLRISHLQEQEHEVRMLDAPRTYRISNYLPFNQDNYPAWEKAPNLTERIQLLQSTMVGHVFTLANALDWKLPERLTIEILHIRKVAPVQSTRSCQNEIRLAIQS